MAGEEGQPWVEQDCKISSSAEDDEVVGPRLIMGEDSHNEEILRNGEGSGSNTSDSSISSTNHNLPGEDGGEGRVVGSVVLGEEDAGSSSHSEVRSSSPGLADADADVEDSPSGSEETGSESDRERPSLPSNSMYAPTTGGFPPSRSALTHAPGSYPLSQAIRYNPSASNPFAVKPSVSTSERSSDKNFPPRKISPFSTPPFTSTGRPIIRPSALSTSLCLSAPLISSSNNVEDSAPSCSILRPPKLSTCLGLKLIEPEAEEKPSSSDENRNPVFVPLEKSDDINLGGHVSSVGQTNPNPKSAFIFGCNLSERVLGGEENDVGKLSDKSGSNGVSSSLFSTVASSDGTFVSSGSVVSGGTPGELALGERKRKLEDPPLSIVTGEEEESNVLQISARLFAFETKTGNWMERGRGSLRLNDHVDGGLQSRIIFRTQGSLQVMLNTKVWGGMKVERPSEKHVQITALDQQQPRVFLIMTSVGDAELLSAALHYRIANLKNRDEVEESIENSSSGPESPKRKRIVESPRLLTPPFIQVNSRNITDDEDDE